MLRDSRSKYINSVCADRQNNPKRFWSLFKLKSNVSNVPEKVSMAKSDGARTSAESPEDIASIFNSYFTSIFTRDEPNTEADSRTNDVATDHENSTNTTLLDDITLTPDHVAAVLRALDNDKAQGPDGIPSRLLTETADQIAPSLCDLFNKSLRTGVVPRDWKLANVVPSLKRLLLRLRDFGLTGNIFNWFRSYLQDRRQQTTILGATSSPSS
jgi:hypothetical protein